MHTHTHSLSTLAEVFLAILPRVCTYIGVWCMVCGVWCMVCGAWCVVHGLWCMVYCAYVIVYYVLCIVYCLCILYCFILYIVLLVCFLVCVCVVFFVFLFVSLFVSLFVCSAICLLFAATTTSITVKKKHKTEYGGKIDFLDCCASYVAFSSSKVLSELVYGACGCMVLAITGTDARKLSLAFPLSGTCLV